MIDDALLSVLSRFYENVRIVPRTLEMMGHYRCSPEDLERLKLLTPILSKYPPI